jgi:hypothetical protein
VAVADDTMLWIEAHSLGAIEEETIRDIPIPLEMEIVSPLLPADAERLFLDRFEELTVSLRP